MTLLEGAEVDALPKWILAEGALGRATLKTQQGDPVMALQIGDTAPDFEAETTEGRIRFHDWIGS